MSQKKLPRWSGWTVGQLQRRYVEVFGEPVRSRHKQYLIRRIAWRLQANAEGGLSERALRRAEELANVADVRVTPPRAAKKTADGYDVDQGGSNARIVHVAPIGLRIHVSRPLGRLSRGGTKAGAYL